MRASLTVLLHKVLSLNPFTPLSGAHVAVRSTRARSNVCGATGVVLVLLRMVTVEVQAQDFTYTTNNDTITITGYNGPGGAVTIPSTIFGLPVTSIGYEAFAFRATLTSITIPDSVTFIGGSAFQGTRLTSVTIPIGVTNIGDYAFGYCSSLTNLTIRDSATSIGDWTFAGCTSLASVTMGKNVTSIGAATFAWCTNLTSVLIPNSVRNLADGAETKGGGIGAFNGCASLTNVAIGNSVTNIGNFVFSGCTSLPNVTIPDSVVRIGSDAFRTCTGLTRVTIPKGVTTIDDGSLAPGWMGGPFRDCTNLTVIEVDALNPAYSGLDGVLFDKNQTAVIAYPAGKAGGYTIPGSVTYIGFGALGNCAKLTQVAIPNSVTNIGSWAFSYCKGLASLIIGNSVTNIGNLAFGGCTSLTKVTIPDSVVSIGDSAFSACYGLTSIALGKGVTSIGVSVFRYCSGLGTVTIGNSVTSIGDEAFSFCTSLTNIAIGKSVTYIGAPFFGCVNLAAITVDPLNPVYSSVDGVLFDQPQRTLIQYPWNKAPSYTIPNSVTRIGDSAFNGYTGLVSVTIGKSVITIGNWAFHSCDSLTNVTLPDSVSSIGDWTFAYCASLEGIYFQGNAPITSYASLYSLNATVYYLPGTIGWGPMFGDRPTMLWNPQARTSDASFGVRQKGFGFNIAGTVDIPLVVEACTNFAAQSWVPLQNCTLTNGLIYFNDPQWTNYPERFYRIRSP